MKTENIPEFYLHPGLNAELAEYRPEFNDPERLRFYTQLAQKYGGPVLEIGSGTGTITAKIAELGIDVVGVDRSAAMQERAKVHSDNTVLKKKIRFIEADAGELKLAERFSLIIAPFHVLQSITDRSVLRRALISMSEMLVDEGVFALDVFAPDLEWLSAERLPDEESYEEFHVGERHIRAELIKRKVGVASQTLWEDWKFSEISKNGAVTKEEIERLVYTWFYRYEMLYLLELSGFPSVEEYGGFNYEGFRYGEEHVLIARKTVG
jgi:SAM-dependent methyltransferase